MKQKYCSVDPKVELSRMIDGIEADERIKEQLKSYLSYK